MPVASLILTGCSALGKMRFTGGWVHPARLRARRREKPRETSGQSGGFSQDTSHSPSVPISSNWRCTIALFAPLHPSGRDTSRDDASFPADTHHAAAAPEAASLCATRFARAFCLGSVTLGFGFALAALSPATGATPHTKQGNANQKALDKAIADKKALMARQANEAALIETRRKDQARAAQEAALQAQKARRYSALTNQAENELDATQKQIDALTNDIASLTARQNDQRLALARRRAALQTILPVALRLARYPGTSVVALSGQADDAVQGLSVIAGLTRLTTRQAEDLRSQKTLLDQTAHELADRNTALEAARRKLAALRDLNASRMETAAHQQAEAEARARQAHDEIAAATAKAATLEDALTAIDKAQASIKARMEAEARELERQNQQAKARALSTQARALSSSGNGVTRGGGHGPVAGRVLTAWHQTTESGPASGITYQASAGSSVSAPCAGQIDFAGPFRSFGNMIILDCGHHFRFVLSGLGGLSVSTGQTISRHAALGTMGGGGGALFVQLRSGSKIIDPGPYL